MAGVCHYIYAPLHILYVMVNTFFQNRHYISPLHIAISPLHICDLKICVNDISHYISPLHILTITYRIAYTFIRHCHYIYVQDPI